jgi:glycine/D-amino acid oxidase-like deaminating enzyme
VITYKAGTIWAYRFVASLYARLLEQYPSQFSIETETMVHDIRTTGDLSHPYNLETNRGSIQATHIVHATDAHAANLLSGLKGKLFPIRGHMTAQRDAYETSAAGQLDSCSIVGKKGYEYVMRRPGGTDGSGGELMLGGGFARSDSQGLDEVGIWEDHEVSTPIVAYLSGIWSVAFRSAQGLPASTLVTHVWSGCMGWTVDLLPYVGVLSPGLTKRKLSATQVNAVTGKGMHPPREWITAGFCGDGMIQAWVCGTAVGLMLLGQEDAVSVNQAGWPDGSVQDWLPADVLISETRLNNSSIYGLSRML